MMDRIVLPAEASPDFEALKNVLHLPEDAEELEDAESMLREAWEVSRPCSLFAAVPIENGGARVGGVDISYPFVAEKLGSNAFAVAYISTCGLEAEKWSLQYKEDPLLSFVADAIKLQLLGAANKTLHAQIKERFYAAGKFSSLNPGSLKLWPITEQETLFSILGGRGAVRDAIGVTLSPSFLMLPSKSTSGIFFATAEEFENCMLCPRESCPNRRAPRVTTSFS